MRKTPLGMLLAAAAAMAVAGAAESAELEFKWQPGMACEVRNSILMQGRGAAPSVVLLFGLHVSRSSDGGLLIETKDARMEPLPGMTADQSHAMGAMIAMTNLPAFRVSAQGELAGVSDFEGARTRLREAYAVSLPSKPDAETLDRIMQFIGTREFFDQIVDTFWIPTVSRWNGLTLEPGKPLAFEGQVKMPVGPPAEIAMKGSIEVSAASACTHGDAKRRCVTLKSTETADQADVKRAILALMEKAGGKMKGSQIDTLEIRSDVETETEPDTLIPHRVLYTKNTTITGKRGEQAHSEAQTERREWSFDCKDAAKQSP